MILLPADPHVAVFAARFPSASKPGETHDVRLAPQGWWECTCPGFAFRDTCRHVTEARAYLAEHGRGT